MNNNPLQFLNFIKNIKNPKETLKNMINSNNNPMLNNLMEMAEKGDRKGVEEFARNLYKGQGRDFDKEFSQFTNNFK